MKKRNLLLATTLLLGGLATNGVSAKEKTEITFWHAMNGKQEETLKSLTKQFEKENPNIKVKLQNQGQYPDLQSKVITAQATPNSLPNITQGYVNWQENAIKNKLLLNLDGSVDSESYVSSYIEPLKTKNGLWGVPFAKSTEILVYNKDIWNELALPIPTTYEEYMAVCQTIKKKKGINGGGFDHLGNLYQTYLKNENININKKLNPTSEKALQPLEYIQKGVKSGAFRLSGADRYLSGAFANEQVASYVGSNAGLTFTEKGVGNKFKWGIAPYPSNKVMQQGTDLFVYKKSSPKEEQASIDYVKFLTNTKSQIKWGTKTGYIPVNNNALNSSQYNKYKYSSVLKECTKKTFTPTTSSVDNRIYLESLKVMEKVANGQKVKTVAKQFKQYIKTVK